MGAAKIILDPAIELSGTALPPGLFARAMAFASFVIVVLALGASRSSCVLDGASLRPS
jgi:hypothetical protein